MIATSTESVLSIATAYIEAGLSVFPIAADGTKKPPHGWRWADYQKRRASATELRRWFGGVEQLGLCIICGQVSGGLEVLDFDDGGVYFHWAEVMEQQSPGLLAKLPVVQTPAGGFHVYYRLTKPRGNQKLAKRPPTAEELALDPKCRSITLIETRGEGGYVLAPGCPAACHESGGLYQHVHGPAITNTPKLDGIIL